MHTSTPTLPTEYTHLQSESSSSLQTTVHYTTPNTTYVVRVSTDPTTWIRSIESNRADAGVGTITSHRALIWNCVSCHSTRGFYYHGVFVRIGLDRKGMRLRLINA